MTGSPTFIKKTTFIKNTRVTLDILYQTRIKSVSFSFSLSVTFHPVISMSLSYKSSTHHQWFRRLPQSRVKLSRYLPSSSSVSSSSPDSFSTILSRLTVSCVLLSSVKNIHESVPVTYLLYLGQYGYCGGINLSQYPLFPVSVRGGDVGPDTPSFTLPPYYLL